jgi:hypothetical protein
MATCGMHSSKVAAHPARLREGRVLHPRGPGRPAPDTGDDRDPRGPTDSSSRRRFAAYWVVVGPLSDLIRRLVLRRLAMHVEHQ